MLFNLGRNNLADVNQYGKDFQVSVLKDERKRYALRAPAWRELVLGWGNAPVGMLNALSGAERGWRGNENSLQISF